MSSCRDILGLKEHEEILETSEGIAAYMSAGAQLVLVTGYYGYGKTYGIGYYLICQAALNKELFLYINMRNLDEILSSVAHGIEKSRAQSLEDILLTLAQVARSNIIKRLIERKAIITNVNLEKLANSIINSDVNDVINTFAKEVTKLGGGKTVYLIIDEFENAIKSLDEFVNRVCKTVRNELHDAGYKNIKIVLLIQKKYLLESNKDQLSCGPGAEGITTTIDLRDGYDPEVYENYIKKLVDITEDNIGEIKKIAKLISAFPPRIAFEFLNRYLPRNQIDSSAFKKTLISVLKNKKEIFLISFPKNSNLYTQIINEIVKDLQNKHFIVRMDKKMRKTYKLTIICEKNKATDVLINLASKPKKSRLNSNAKMNKSQSEKWDVAVYPEGDYLAIETNKGIKYYVLKFRHFLMAYSPAPPDIQGLTDMYNEFRQEFTRALSRVICKT